MPDALIDPLGRQCYARGCAEKREKGYIMCTPHWQLLVPALQRKVIRAVGAYIATPTIITKAALIGACNVAKTNADFEQTQRDAKLAEAAKK